MKTMLMNVVAAVVLLVPALALAQTTDRAAATATTGVSCCTAEPKGCGDCCGACCDAACCGETCASCCKPQVRKSGAERPVRVHPKGTHYAY